MKKVLIETFNDLNHRIQSKKNEIEEKNYQKHEQNNVEIISKKIDLLRDIYQYYTKLNITPKKFDLSSDVTELINELSSLIEYEQQNKKKSIQPTLLDNIGQTEKNESPQPTVNLQKNRFTKNRFTKNRFTKNRSQETRSIKTNF